MSNKQGGGWTDLQIMTHFRNALRDKVLRWFNVLPLLDVNNLDCKIVKNQFEQDFRATPTVSLVIQKLPEIKQKDSELVIQYVNRFAEFY